MHGFAESVEFPLRKAGLMLSKYNGTLDRQHPSKRSVITLWGASPSVNDLSGPCTSSAVKSLGTVVQEI